MKKIILTALVFGAIYSNAQSNWKVDASHSKVGFSVTHMMISETEGNFKIYDGKVSSKSDKDFTDATIEFSADVKSINTEDEKRDEHLKAADFFDAEKYPKLTFKSTSMKKGKSPNTYVLTGDLTIKDVTKKVTLTAVYGGATKDPWGNTRSGFKVTGSINRLDYGLKWNAVLEAGGVAVSEKVNLSSKVELILQK